MKQLVIGMGEIGKPLYDILCLSCDEVYGRDEKPNDKPAWIDVLHICFPHGFTFVQNVKAYTDLYKPSLCIVHSTVVPGTTDQIGSLTECDMAYSPIKGRHGQMHRDLLHYPKFVAGNHKAGMVLYDAGFDVRWMQSTGVLELAKLLETTYSGLLIAWAQEMERYCHTLPSAYLEAVRFFEGVPYLPSVVFQPGFIGGHCIMPNLDLLECVKPSEFIDLIRSSNEEKGERGDSDADERLTPIHFHDL